MAPSRSKRNKVFISYSHRDTDWLDRIRIHLKPLERDYAIDIWDDTQIQAGMKWREEITRALESAKAALLVVSADFLASDFIINDELPLLLEAAQREGAVILPLIVSPSRFESTKTLSQFQAINDPSKPLIKMTKGEQEEVLVKVTEDIETALKLETSMREYLSPQVIAELRRDPRQLRLRPETRRVTILHSGIMGFTSLSEQWSPEAVARCIHEYLTDMTDIVFRFGGTLDSYSGDVLTAYWGAPIQLEDSAARACRAALEMIQAVRKLNPKLLQEGIPPLSLMIAITTGNVTVGNLGSEQRFHYSILGGILDVLPRLLRANDSFHTEILLTEYTYAEIQDKFVTRLLAEQMHFKGKRDPISVYELLAPIE